MRARSRIILSALGITVSVVPPAVATLSYFPLWQDEGAAPLLSGICLFLMLTAGAPLIKLLRTRLATPSVPLIWLAVFIAFAALGRIADEVAAIALVGTVSNILGAILLRAARVGRKNDEA